MTPPSPISSPTIDARSAGADEDVLGFGAIPAFAGAEATTDGSVDAMHAIEAMRAGYLGPDWIGPALIAVLFSAMVVAIVVLSGGAHWQAW